MKKKEDIKKVYERELTKDFIRWNQIYTYGGSDPFWSDGYNLNLIRNHIISYKNELKELEYFPEIYKRETPPEVEDEYMSRAEEIQQNARASLEIYLANEDYQYLKENTQKYSKKDLEKISLYNVLRYVDSLIYAIKNNDLISMRRHENPKGYLQSFSDCKKKLQNLSAEQEKKELRQLNIFEYL